MFRVAIFFFISKGPPSSVDGWGHLSSVRFSCRVIFKTTFSLIKRKWSGDPKVYCPYLKRKHLATCPRIIFEVGESTLEHFILGQIKTCLEIVFLGLQEL